jgi:hypothetical protein
VTQVVAFIELVCSRRMYEQAAASGIRIYPSKTASVAVVSLTA